MKKLVTVEIDLCDHCQGDTHGSYKCLYCDAVSCFTCKPKHLQTLSRSVFGSDGPYICHLCHLKLLAIGNDPLFNALYRIAQLRKQHDNWWALFEPQMRFAEAEAERLEQERRKK